jgi:hypothetical protein
MSTQLPQTFEPENQEGNSWELVPEGEYVAEIVEASVAQPKSLDGYHLALVWKITKGEYENRQVWQRITYLHSSETAQSIGRKILKDLCTALDVNEHVEDIEVFLFKPARIRVGIERDKDGKFDDKNKVKRIVPLNSATPVASASLAKETPQAATPKSQSPIAAKGPTRPGPAGSAPWHQK